MPTDDYYREFAAEERQKHEAEVAAFKRLRAEQIHREPLLHEISDPSVSGPDGVTGYAWMGLRGD
jgi:hypothetical protein